MTLTLSGVLAIIVTGYSCQDSTIRFVAGDPFRLRLGFLYDPTCIRVQTPLDFLTNLMVNILPEKLLYVT